MDGSTICPLCTKISCLRCPILGFLFLSLLFFPILYTEHCSEQPFKDSLTINQQILFFFFLMSMTSWTKSRQNSPNHLQIKWMLCFLSGVLLYCLGWPWTPGLRSSSRLKLLSSETKNVCHYTHRCNCFWTEIEMKAWDLCECWESPWRNGTVTDVQGSSGARYTRPVPWVQSRFVHLVATL